MELLIRRAIILLPVFFILLLSRPLLAQWPTNELSFKKSGTALHAGINYSMTTVHQENPIVLQGLKSKIGYYIGGLYYHDLSSILTSRVDLSYQLKGTVATNPIGRPSIDADYHYISLTPSIGVKPFKRLTLLIGPQVNWLVAKHNVLGKGKIIELGVVGQLSYQLSLIHIEIGYFGGLTTYDRIDLINASFYNQNWQTGVSYRFR